MTKGIREVFPQEQTAELDFKEELDFTRRRNGAEVSLRCIKRGEKWPMVGGAGESLNFAAGDEMF